MFFLLKPVSFYPFRASQLWLLLLATGFFFTSCSAQKQLPAAPAFFTQFLADTVLQHAFTGVAVYDATARKYLLQHNSDKYFVPASNTKIPTLYAGLKYLGTQLPGLLYARSADTLYLAPTGDPSFLHPDYSQQPVFDFLRTAGLPLAISNVNWKSNALGFGWAWDDFQSAYMAERSPFPVYGNVVTWTQERIVETREGQTDTSTLIYTQPEINWPVLFAEERSRSFDVNRPRTENRYTIRNSAETRRSVQVPFVTNGLQGALELLPDTLQKNLQVVADIPAGLKMEILFSQPSDSLFRPLMHRSDNFFAEQTLLMVSRQLLGFMDEQRLIDTLLKSDLKGFPQPPKWVDGSGLSRYNLFTPEDFVWLLEKMKDEFGLERMQLLFPTGNTGTLRNYYIPEKGLLFAKTGTLSSHVALSGYLVTSKNRLLIFSVLVNNHYTSATAIRRSVERFMQQVRKAY
ncbi:MAG TPA: D-alanyl-D-alanine carboxypeptidase [Lacibacter sp.]|nr:D-alanyl-D-alanine carboxypeptidase [Lacibacter sp.]